MLVTTIPQGSPDKRAELASKNQANDSHESNQGGPHRPRHSTARSCGVVVGREDSTPLFVDSPLCEPKQAKGAYGQATPWSVAGKLRVTSLPTADPVAIPAVSNCEAGMHRVQQSMDRSAVN